MKKYLQNLKGDLPLAYMTNFIVRRETTHQLTPISKIHRGFLYIEGELVSLCGKKSLPICLPFSEYVFDYSEETGGLWLKTNFCWVRAIFPNKIYQFYWRNFNINCARWIKLEEFLGLAKDTNELIKLTNIDETWLVKKKCGF